MTTEQFEAYLQSIGGLVNGWREDRDPIVSRHFCSCGDGWLQLIHDLIEELLAAGWDKHILQIKEKFGGLRFYIGSGSEEIHDIISKYEHLSYETCEVCGETGRIRNDLGWIPTLCDKHYKELVVTKTQEAIQSGVNSVMKTGFPVVMTSVPKKHERWNMWEVNVFWEIPDYHKSEAFTDVLECLKDCETFIDNMSKEDKEKLRKTK